MPALMWLMYFGSWVKEFLIVGLKNYNSVLWLVLMCVLMSEYLNFWQRNWWRRNEFLLCVFYGEEMCVF
jgi:uncharacterized membrane protein